MSFLSIFQSLSKHNNIIQQTILAINNLKILNKILSIPINPSFTIVGLNPHTHTVNSNIKSIIPMSIFEKNPFPIKYSPVIFQLYSQFI